MRDSRSTSVSLSLRRLIASVTSSASAAFYAAICLTSFLTLVETPAALAATLPNAADMPAVLAEAFNDIGDYYIEPVSMSALAVSGISRLDTPSHGLQVEAADNSVVLRLNGTEFAREQEPQPNDAQGWADLISRSVIQVRRHVPDLQKMSEDETYNRLFMGFIQRLDRFTRYAGPSTADDQRAQRDGFGGIGVVLDYGDGLPRVTEVLPEGPAAQAGLRVDDRLASIDGYSLSHVVSSDIPNRLRGAIGTPVTIEIQRADVQTRVDVHLVRALVVPPTVTTSLQPDGVAVFRLALFNHATATSLASAIARTEVQLGRNLHGAILDLRDNPGGLLDQGVDVASLFLDGGPVISTNGRHPKSLQKFSADDHDRLRGLPLAVLVNGGSASASEIVAAALQDRGRAVMVGSSSYGKGTVQMVLTLPNNAELTLTWARMVTPGGYILHKHGIVPAFCTAQAPADPENGPAALNPALLSKIILAEQHPASSLVRMSRSRLSDAEWSTLRQICPPVNDDKSYDMAVADQVLADTQLYGAALMAPGVPVAGLAPVARKIVSTSHLAH